MKKEEAFHRERIGEEGERSLPPSIDGGEGGRGRKQKCKSWKRRRRTAERARGGRLSSFLSLSLPFHRIPSPQPLSLSLSQSVWFHVQVARPPIGGRERRCAWVGEAW